VRQLFRRTTLRAILRAMGVRHRSGPTGWRQAKRIAGPYVAASLEPREVLMPSQRI
jgi:hypothetical protein